MTGSCEGAGYSENCNDSDTTCDPRALVCDTDGSGRCICNSATHYDNGVACSESKSTFLLLSSKVLQAVWFVCI